LANLKSLWGGFPLLREGVHNIAKEVSPLQTGLLLIYLGLRSLITGWGFLYFFQNQVRRSFEKRGTSSVFENQARKPVVEWGISDKFLPLLPRRAAQIAKEINLR